MHTQKMAGTKVTPDCDGSVYSIILHVHGGVMVKKVREKMKTISCFGNLLWSCFDVSDSVILLSRQCRISFKARWTKY